MRGAALHGVARAPAASTEGRDCRLPNDLADYVLPSRVPGFQDMGRAALIALGAAFLLTALAGAAAAAEGMAWRWHAVAAVLEAGTMASLALGLWMHERPWHLERAPEAVSLANLQVVPRYYLDRLAALGIFTVTSLRRADAQWTALGIGATEDMVRRWQARAELHLLAVREEVLGWSPTTEERWPALMPGTGAFGRGAEGRQEDG